MRDQFLLDPDLVFLNHGSFGACPREVFETFQHWQREMERNPVQFLGRRSAQLLGDARAALAGYVGAQAEDLVFVPNATTGVNVVARSLPLQPGDEILATDHEYGACDATWQFVCQQRGAVYRHVEIPLPFEHERFVERMMAAVTPRTRVLFVSHITSTTALIFPMAALCAAARERGLLTLIDGAHAPGQLPLDLAAIGADFYTGNAHKWLCAPKGAAFLHAQPQHHALLEAPIVSWGYAAEVAGHTGFDAYTGRTTLERRLQWQGTRDLAAYLTVPAAIQFQARHDWPAVRQRCHAMARDALHRIAGRYGLAPVSGDDDFAQMVVIPVPHHDAEALRRRLFDDSGIEIPVTQHAGHTFVRLSVQGYTTDEDIRRLETAPALSVD
ncbi:MAG: aminotransferase class V-fold PLP-dependent enzyme [Rubrivivax sp.]